MVTYFYVLKDFWIMKSSMTISLVSGNCVSRLSALIYHAWSFFPVKVCANVEGWVLEKKIFIFQWNTMGFAKLDMIRIVLQLWLYIIVIWKRFMFQNLMSARKPFKSLDPKKNKLVCYFIFYRHINGHYILYINCRGRPTDEAYPVVDI